MVTCLSFLSNTLARVLSRRDIYMNSNLEQLDSLTVFWNGLCSMLEVTLYFCMTPASVGVLLGSLFNIEDGGYVTVIQWAFAQMT